jgi:iron complex outermembrane receptor protein
LPAGVSCSTVGPPIAPFAGFYIDNPTVGNALCQTSIPLPSWQQTQEDVTSQAAFGAVNWDVTDTVELSAGLRWLKDTKDFHGAFYTATAPSAIDPPMEANTTTPDPGFPVKQNEDWDRTISKFTATWRPTDTNTLYASYSEGFRSGGFSNRGNDPRFLAYKPETAKAYEIGSKNEFWDRRLRLNMAAFYTLVEQGQFSSIITTNGRSPGTNTIINNGGDVDIYGFETDLAVDLTETLSAIATFGYLTNSSDEFSISSERVPFPANGAAGTACNPADNPQYFPNAPALDPNTCPTVELGGGDLGRAPKYNYSITGIYQTSFGGNDFAVSASFRWQDSFIIVGGATSPVGITEDAYSIVDARAMYQWNMKDGEFVRFALTGKNLTDTEYLDQALPLGANGGFQGWGSPRTYALEVTWQR